MAFKQLKVHPFQSSSFNSCQPAPLHRGRMRRGAGRTLSARARGRQGPATGSCDWSAWVNHNTIVYQYRSWSQRRRIVPAHYTHSVIQCRPITRAGCASLVGGGARGGRRAGVPSEVWRCKLDPGLKAAWFLRFKLNSEQLAFNLNPGLSEPAPLHRDGHTTPRASVGLRNRGLL